MTIPIRALILLAVSSLPGWAGATLALTPTVENGLPGGEVIFSGTFGVSNGDPNTFFNDLSANFTPPADVYLTLDTNVFFANTPGVLCGNDPSCQQSYTGPIFGVQIAPGTPTGQYFGTLTMLGGADPSFFDPLTSPAAFQVNVQSPIPEPGTFLLACPLIAAGLLAIAAKRGS
jgi:hypothetical protein